MVTFPRYHMSNDAQIYNLQFDPDVFQCSKHGPDSPLEGPSLGQLGPHGSWGFSPVGGNRCTLRGNWCTSSRKKGRRTAGTPDGACGHPERQLPARPLRGFLATRSGEGRFSSGKICARANAPQNGRLHCGGGPENKSGALHTEQSPLPFHGAGSLGLNALEDHPW